MTEAEVENELQNLKAQLALLQEEHAKTRNGWLWWLRNTGFMLTVFSVAVFAGVLMSHVEVSSNPIAISLIMMSLFMLAFGLWLMAWSIRRLWERMMWVAPRQ
jgi:Na+/melibiose symporter-like transporter